MQGVSIGETVGEGYWKPHFPLNFSVNLILLKKLPINLEIYILKNPPPGNNHCSLLRG